MIFFSFLCRCAYQIKRYDLGTGAHCAGTEASVGKTKRNAVIGSPHDCIVIECAGVGDVCEAMCRSSLRSVHIAVQEGNCLGAGAGRIRRERGCGRTLCYALFGSPDNSIDIILIGDIRKFAIAAYLRTAGKSVKGRLLSARVQGAIQVQTLSALKPRTILFALPHRVAS